MNNAMAQFVQLLAKARADRIMREINRAGACDPNPASTHRRDPHAKGVLTDAKEF
jgi:hypothetical protein